MREGDKNEKNKIGIGRRMKKFLTSMRMDSTP